MYLSPTEMQKANKKREVISKHFLDGVRLCNVCSGTGLKGVQTNSCGDSMWDGVSFCDKCEGIGYLTWKETVLHKLCSRCDGAGCDVCNNEGVLDWIQYMRVGDKT